MAESNRTRNVAPHRYTARELEIFASVQKSHFRARASTAIGRYAFMAVIAWAIAWGAVHSFESLGGKVTALSVLYEKKDGSEAVELVRKIFEALSTLLNIVLYFFYRNARKRQDNTILQLAPFREMYEVVVDERRSTSGLQRDGNTPPEEKP